MQVVIEEVVNRFREKGEGGLSEGDFRDILFAVREIIADENRRNRQVAEEMSLGNHVSRPGLGG
jgi:hypothetical protein